MTQKRALTRGSLPLSDCPEALKRIRRALMASRRHVERSVGLGLGAAFARTIRGNGVKFGAHCVHSDKQFFKF